MISYMQNLSTVQQNTQKKLLDNIDYLIKDLWNAMDTTSQA